MTMQSFVVARANKNLPVTDTIRVCEFQSEDTDAVVALWKDALPSSRTWNDPHHVICRKRQHSGELFIVGERQNRVVATVVVGAELGYWLAQLYWGRGITSAAVRTVCQFAFAEYQLLRVFAGVFGGNMASVRVLENAGVQHAGTLRNHEFNDGKCHDILLFGLMRDERQKA